MDATLKKKSRTSKRPPVRPRAGFETVEAFFVDMNGVPRGKWVPESSIKKITSAGLRMALSAFAVDIWGEDVIESGLIKETGDSDGNCRLVDGSLRPMPWLKNTAQALLTVDGFFGDPRQVLARVLDRYQKAGLTPVIAAELEFYLIDARRDEYGGPVPARAPATGRRAATAQTYSLSTTDDFRSVLADISRFCAAQNLPADTTISENGPGQFEINLSHKSDALAAADDAVFLKRLIKGAARRHGLAATFMAKPYSRHAGSGMHAHFSVLDRSGRNIFAGKNAKGSAALHHAIGGLCKTMADGMAVFAPNVNAFRRFAAASPARAKIAWGYDNRAAALRVPHSDIAATRIEHRVAGADANPYLVFALILAGALEGIEKKTRPPAPAKGEHCPPKTPSLPVTPDDALDLFARSRFIDRALGPDYKKIYLACKWQEMDVFASEVTSAEHDAYLMEA